LRDYKNSHIFVVKDW